MNYSQACAALDDHRKYVRATADNLNTIYAMLDRTIYYVWKDRGLDLQLLDVVEFDADDMKGWLTIKDRQVADLSQPEYESLCEDIRKKHLSWATSAQLRILFRRDGDTFTVGTTIYREVTSI